MTLPDNIARIARDDTAECSEHGVQQIVRKATEREVVNWALALPLDYDREYPDEPPF